jgi:peptide/nickel transport system ATP-binding protein
VVAKICASVTVLHEGAIVEQAPVADIFARPAHAYTRALLAATPRYDRPTGAPLPVELQ